MRNRRAPLQHRALFAFVTLVVTAALAAAPDRSFADAPNFIPALPPPPAPFVLPDLVWPMPPGLPTSLTSGYSTPMLNEWDVVGSWDVLRATLKANATAKGEPGGASSTPAGPGSAGGSKENGAGVNDKSGPGSSGTSSSPGSTGQMPAASSAGAGGSSGAGAGGTTAGDGPADGAVGGVANCTPPTPPQPHEDLARNVGNAVIAKRNDDLRTVASQLPPEQRVDRIHQPDKCEMELIPQDANTRTRMDEIAYRSFMAANKPRYPAPHTGLPHTLITDMTKSKGWCLRGAREAITGKGIQLGEGSFGIERARDAGRVLKARRWKDISGGLAACHGVSLSDPGAVSKLAPPGSVLVYEGGRGKGAPFGHVEIKTSDNHYCSDFCSPRPIDMNTRLGRKLIGIWVPDGSGAAD